MRYKVILFYQESKPELSGRTFEIDYDVEATGERAALQNALRQFTAYEGHSYASWIRTVLEEHTIVVPELAGRFLDAYTPAELSDWLDRNPDPALLVGAVEGIRWVIALREDTGVAARLYALLAGGEVPVRIACVETLRRSGRPEAVERFSRMIRDEPDARVRASLIAGVGERGVGGMLPVIYEDLAHADDRVRANAVEAVERLGTADDLPRLLPLAEDATPRVRANVIKAVWRLGKFHQSEHLGAMLASPDERMRASAAYALGEIAGEQTLPRLFPLAADPSPMVRRNVIKSLRKSKRDDALVHLIGMLAEPDAECRALLGEAIVVYGDAAREPLLAALSDPARRDNATAILDLLAKVILKDGRLFEWLSLAFRRRVG